MKKSEKFIINEIAGSNVLVPFDEGAVDFNGIITLNDTAAFLWNNAGEEFDVDSLTELICKSYEDVDGDTARVNAERFINTLKEVGALE